MSTARFTLDRRGVPAHRRRASGRQALNRTGCWLEARALDEAASSRRSQSSGAVRTQRVRPVAAGSPRARPERRLSLAWQGAVPIAALSDPKMLLCATPADHHEDFASKALRPSIS